MSPDIYRPKSVYHPSADLLPAGFAFPQAYLEYVNREEVDELYPWYFLCHFTNESFNFWLEYMKTTYPDRQLVPFARWSDSDDFVCFEPSEDPNLPSIHYIHTFTDPGYEERGYCATFEKWLETSLEEALDYQADNPDYADDFAD